MNNDIKIINYENFEDYIGALVKLSNKDIHRKMVEQYEDHYFEHGHDWGYGVIERHNDKPGVLLVDVKADGVNFETEEFSFDEDLYIEALKVLKTSYISLHKIASASYLEITLKDCLEGLYEANKRIDKNSYYDKFPYYRRVLQKLKVKLKSDFEYSTGKKFIPNNIPIKNIPDTNEVAKEFRRRGNHHKYDENIISIVMTAALDFVIDNPDKRVNVERIYRDAKDQLLKLQSEGEIEVIPSRNTIRNWIEVYLEKAGVLSKSNESS